MDVWSTLLSGELDEETWELNQRVWYSWNMSAWFCRLKMFHLKSQADMETLVPKLHYTVCIMVLEVIRGDHGLSEYNPRKSSLSLSWIARYLSLLGNYEGCSHHCKVVVLIYVIEDMGIASLLIRSGGDQKWFSDKHHSMPIDTPA